MTSVSLRGVEIPLHQRFSEAIRASLSNGSYEQPECETLDGILLDDDRVLELGSGLGFLAVRCAQRLGSGRVLTVEADPEMRPVLLGTFAANHVAPGLMIGAVSAEGRPRRLERAEDLWSTRTAASSGQGDIPGIRLSTLITWRSPTVLVIDIEGGESELGPTPLPGVRAVLVECHSRRDLYAVTEWLEPQGFALTISARRIRLFQRTDPSTVPTVKGSHGEHV